jgi:50S ribosomal subunit-associated GTPase HflX
MDRFNIILSIFSKRAKSELSQLQIELAYLRYVKSKLARGGHVNYGHVYKEFKGGYFENYRDYETVSGKQSAGKGSVGGSGETQLELDKRRVSDREFQIRGALERIVEKRKIERLYRRENSSRIPTLALVGYTNAGKTALMNELAKTTLESENKLFQTLNTTIKK